MPAASPATTTKTRGDDTVPAASLERWRDWIPALHAGGHARVEALLDGAVSHVGAIQTDAALDALASFILLPGARRNFDDGEVGR